MRDRLIELIGSKVCEAYSPTCDEWQPHSCEKCFANSCRIGDLADYLLANGVVVPPCKVGDTVYEIEKSCLRCMHFVDGDYSNFCECTLDDSKLMFECDFDKECCYDIVPKRFDFGMIERIGKTVFLTKEEAEKALAEKNKNN